MPKVAVVMGSKSDFSGLEAMIQTLKRCDVEVVVRVLSAHRTPDAAADFAKSLEADGYEVLIAAAGKAAHLPGVLAAHTLLPVIGVPMKSSLMDGLDSLLSIVQMPTGIPVATVGVGGGDNAALLALQMLGIKYPAIREALADLRGQMQAQVMADDARIQATIEMMI